VLTTVQQPADLLPVYMLLLSCHLLMQLTGYCAWPALMWSIDLCLRATWPDIVLTFTPGKLLVRFYGEHIQLLDLTQTANEVG